MKSLEIVNRYQEALDTIKRDYGLGSVSKKEFPTPEEVENAIKTLESAIILLEVLQEQLETIKQDLDVLEILRKHIHLRRFENMNRNEVMISPLISENEREKLKQWLEENQNEICN